MGGFLVEPEDYTNKKQDIRKVIEKLKTTVNDKLK